MWDEQIEKLNAVLGEYGDELYTDIKPSELTRLKTNFVLSC